MANKICKHCFVNGHVQGVSFRYYTRQKAQSLGVSGWAHNLADGRVEVLAYGEPSAVEQLCAWLHQGPSFASVTDVQCKIVTRSDYPTGFEIG